MEVKIKTLTPLWTGGVETGKCDRIHETGILGSLRWWMEVLVRGMGGKVDDPTSESRSGLDPKKFDVKAYRQLQDEAECRQYLRNAGLCDVSQIFGATGWKRCSRLDIQEIQVSDATIQHPIKANRTYTDSRGNSKTPTWYFPDAKPPNAPKIGSFILKIQGLHPDFKPEIIGGLIQFIADWSALGARPQMGFGVIQVEGSRIDMQPLYDWLEKVECKYEYPELPSLQNIFLAKIQPQDSSKFFTEQDTFNLKYDLRQLFRADKNLQHFIMGTVKDKRMATKIKISRPYEDDGKSTMRVWGSIPTQAEVYKNDWNRERVVKEIYQHLIENYTLHEWREMNSTRDLVKSSENDAQAFLRSLLKIEDCDGVSQK